MSIRIRPASTNDAEPMYRLSLAARKGAYVPFLNGVSLEKFNKAHLFTPDKRVAFATSLQKYIDMPHRYRADVCITGDGEVVGYIKATLTPASVYISNLYVKPSAQGQGIGEVLLNNIYEISAGRTIVLDVVRDNRAAVNFYVKRGFTEVDRLKRTYYSLEMIRMQRVSKTII